jgi:HlyD family secretion protein
LKKLLILLLVVVAAVITWGVLRRSEPPKAAFAKVKRQTLVSTLPTNGKVEPFEWQEVRAEIPGVAGAVYVQEGQAVAKGARLAAITDPTLNAAIESAEAKVAEARAAVAAIEAGGRPSEFAEIDNAAARAKLDLEQAQKEAATLSRLQARQAATAAEVSAAEDKARQAQTELQGLEKRRAALVSKPEAEGARARLADAEAALRLARAHGVQNKALAPIGGVVFELAARPGTFLEKGALVANVGRMDRLRVKVYVDEPELGRVSVGNPVTITWDALPGRHWEGSVERKPSSIQALGSRQVGQVICTIENSGRELTAGANVNAEIRTAVVEKALVIPKEGLRHDPAGDYVFVLSGRRLERRAVRPGVSSITQTHIAEGLNEGDAIALPSDTPLKAGLEVTPEIQ